MYCLIFSISRAVPYITIKKTKLHIIFLLNSENKPDENQIREHQAEVEGAYNELLQLAAVRRARLEESLKLQSFYRNADEEEMWVTEKDYFVQSTDYGHDLNTAIILLNKHEVH